jgi:hypothetical protein
MKANFRFAAPFFLLSAFFCPLKAEEDFFSSIAEEMVTDIVQEKGMTVEAPPVTGNSYDVDDDLYAEIASMLFGQELFNQDQLFSDAYGTDHVDEKIRQALDLNEKGKLAEALIVLRDLVKTTEFKDIKAQYFLAKQYVICLEKNIFASSAKAEQLERCTLHINGVEEKLSRGTGLSYAQKDYYAKGLADLMRRFDALGNGERPAVVADSASESVTPAVRTNNTPVVTNGGGSLSAVDNPIARLNITSPDQIDRQTAETILKGLDIMKGNRSFTDSLKIINWSCTYSKGSGTFDARMKQNIFKHYQSYREAVTKYSHLPNISERDTPQLYEQWINTAANSLTAVPAADRIKLMKSLMTQESGRTQWRNFKPVVSYAGAIGTGQFMYATAEDIDINPYDPEENIKGIAIYLNSLIRSSGLRRGLARYNGGNNPPSSSFQYADAITSRMTRLA